MITFIWKYKYLLYSIIFSFFVLSIFVLRNPNIYYESERILQYADELDIDSKEFSEKTNLLLVGAEYSKPINFEEFKDLEAIHFELLENEQVVFVQNIHNDFKLFKNDLFGLFGNLSKIKNNQDFENYVDKLIKNNSLYISKDLKKVFFALELDNNLDEKLNTNFIDFLEQRFNSLSAKEVYITGQTKAEIYIKNKVISELIYITLFSAILCSLILWMFSKNFKFVSIVLLSVIYSVFITLMISQTFFGGIELVMIIMPAILFIVCISDFMHLVNNNNKFDNKLEYFKSQIRNIGKPVALTSITTAIGFLSFCFSSVVPILRLGIITTIGIIISLIIILITYAICIDLKLNRYDENNIWNKNIDRFILYLTNLRNSKASIPILTLMLSLCFYGLYNFEINNHVNDEFNKSSKLYKEMSFFDDNFSGYKQVTFNIQGDNNSDIKNIKSFEKHLSENGFNIDISISDLENTNGFQEKLKGEVLIIKTRMKDIGSSQSLELINAIKEKSKDLNINVKVSGNGHLFDKLSNKITKEILLGLLLAISSISLLFLFISNFNFRYLLVILIPNTFPILVCIGIMSLGEFYFSISNAFIFAIVFGLIVDDSIHIITSYRSNLINGLNKSDALERSLTITGRAVLKTTVIILLTLFPLLFSEFNSISQLGILTIISAIIAIVFDLIYLPQLIKKYL